jgi:peptidoglycan/LPS O-acetylase OafA/YrhL
MAVAVGFFFLLSGYVLSITYLREGEDFDKRRFFAARFARIYPLYGLVVVACAIKLIGVNLYHFGIAGLGKAAAVFFLHLVMLQAWFPATLVEIDRPSWSLSAEAFFYLCFPIVGTMVWRLHRRSLKISAVVLYLAGQALAWGAGPYLSPAARLFWPPLQISTFALGVVLARWQTLERETARRSAAKPWQSGLVLALSMAAIMVIAFVLPKFHAEERYFDGLLAPSFAGIVWALSEAPIWLAEALSARWLMALGNASYAIYLVHIPLLDVFLHFHWVTRADYVAYLALCIGLSLLSFYYFETPARLWLLEWFHSRSVEPVDVGV